MPIFPTPASFVIARAAGSFDRSGIGLSVQVRLMADTSALLRQGAGIASAPNKVTLPVEKSRALPCTSTGVRPRVRS